MKRFVAALLGSLTLAAASHLAPARADVDIHIGIPAPPVITFRVQPEVVLVPETRVYYAPKVVDYDMYRYGSHWYINQGGHWYRSNAYGGPYAFVEYPQVPQAVITVPVEYRHHPRHRHGKRSKKHHRHHHDDDD